MQASVYHDAERADGVFLDAAGTCLILVKRDASVNLAPEDHGGMHHVFAVAHNEYKAALDPLRAHGVESTLEEDRQGWPAQRPRACLCVPMALYSRSLT